MSLWGREPVAIAAGVQLVLAALVALGVIELTADQLNAVYAALVAVLGLAVRTTVWAPANVEIYEIPDDASDIITED